ncbi:MAG: acetyl-CoA carboxylase biotin carboxyl carrier protein [Burkholderiales bacterium]|nr:acetyl-CoA carboxylase biotin carboxyl carrier protein [Burkholderiales bacterium]
MPDDRPAPLSNDEIIELLKVLDESKFDELRLEMSGFKLVLSKGADAAARVAPEGSSRATPAPPAPARVEPAGVHPAEEGLVAVRSPILGIFYRAPRPGAPPFVEVGSEVRADDTVCLIEVMKLFNTVTAGAAGRIARICAENAKMVEYGQVLFLIEPAAGAEHANAAE